MARRLRIQYPDAIYHVMARGNAGQDIVGGDDERRRLLAALEQSVRRSGWVLYAFVFMTNHLHLVLKTPRANLATGMQLFLSSYATWWARRHPPSRRAFVPEPVSQRTGRGRDLPLGAHPLHSFQSRARGSCSGPSSGRVR